jgi:hypothetical protein
MLPLLNTLLPPWKYLERGSFAFYFRSGNFELNLFFRDRITSGGKPMCLFPNACDYQSGYRLGRHPVTSFAAPMLR